MKLTLTLCVLAALMGSSFTASISQGNEAIHDLMKDTIGPAFKVLANEMKAGKITAKGVLAGKTLLQGFQDLQAQTPDEASDGAGGVRPITPDEILTFQQFNADMIALFQTLVPQLEANDLAGAQVTAQKIIDLRKQAHEQFKGD